MMKDLDIQTVKLVFENCEELKLPKSEVFVLDLGEVKKEVSGWGNVWEDYVAKDVAIVIKHTIKDTGVKLSYDGYGEEDTLPLLEKLAKNYKIVRIELMTEEEVIGQYRVSWSNTSHTENKDILYEFNEQGDLLILINEGAKAKKKYTELIHNIDYLNYLMEGAI